MARICVPVCVRRIDEMRQAADRAAEVGDMVEVRLDYLNEPETAITAVRELTDRIAAQIIVTMRAADQGGAGSHNYEVRRRFWPRAKDLSKALFDIEFDLLTQAEGFSPDWNRVICSHHDFRGVPHDLDQLYERMAITPARILKIAIQADEVVDCLPVFRLLERARSEGRELIAIAMSQAGIMTRVLGPSRGSFLTYGSLDEESETAPGQLTAKDLREVYRIDRINPETEIFGIIGNPVSYSLSPRLHNAAFAASGIDSVYIPFEVHDAAQFMRRMVHPKTRELDWKLQGLSVTAPHKSTVMSCLDWIDPAAQEIGAVNTILVRDDQLLGYNTDAEGFIAPLRDKFGSLEAARFAVIGAGGAARAVLWRLRKEGAKATLFARSHQKVREMAERFDAECRPVTSQSSFADFDIVVNATPLGTRGEHESETPAQSVQLRGVRLAYDLVYNPIETRFLSEARSAGCVTLSGIEMLLAQAVEQFKLWTGSEPDTQTMWAAASKALRGVD